MSVPRVKITQLGNQGDKEEIRHVFQKFGPLTNVWIATNPPGFAYVFYETFKDAEKAVRHMDGKRLCGVSVDVELSPIEDRNKQGQRFDRGRGRGGGNYYQDRRYSGGGGDQHRDGGQQRYSRQDHHEFRSPSRGRGGGRPYQSSSDYDNRRSRDDRYSSDDGYGNEHYSSSRGGRGRERGGGRGHYDSHGGNARRGGRDYQGQSYGNRGGRYEYNRRGGGGGDYGGGRGRGGGPPSRQYHDNSYRSGDSGNRYRNDYKFERGRGGRSGGNRGGDYHDDEDYRPSRPAQRGGFGRGRGGSFGGRGRGGGGGRSYGGGGGYDDRGDYGGSGRGGGGRRYTKGYDSDMDNARRRPPRDEQYGREYHGGRGHRDGGDGEEYGMRPSSRQHRNTGSGYHHTEKGYARSNAYHDRYSGGGGGGYQQIDYQSDEGYRDRSPHESHHRSQQRHERERYRRKQPRLSQSSSGHHYRHERRQDMSRSPSLSSARSLSPRSMSSTYSSRSRSRSRSRSQSRSRSRSPRSPRYSYSSATIDTQRYHDSQPPVHETQPIYEQPEVFPPADISEYHTEDSYVATTHYHQGGNRHVEYENQAFVTTTAPEQRTVSHKPSEYVEESAGGESREVREIKYSKQREPGGSIGDRFISMEDKPEGETVASGVPPAAVPATVVEGDQAPIFAEGEHKPSNRRSSRQARYSDGSFSPPQRRVRPTRAQRGGSPSRKKRSEWHDICVMREENAVTT